MVRQSKMTNLAVLILLPKLKKLRDEGYRQKDAAKELGKSEASIRSLSRRHGIMGWPQGAAARNQKGPANPNYINGASSATVNRITKQILSEVGRDLFTCERCGTVRDIELPRHHKDRNRKNNTAGNLEVLCVGCHNKEHMHERLRRVNGTWV